MAKKCENKYVDFGLVTILRVTKKNNYIYTQFDSCFLELVKKYQWYCDSNGYIRTHIRKSDGGGYLFMHQLICFGSRMSKHKIHVDHIDRNKLNNTKKNLRLCTAFENSCNRASNKTGCVGVYYDKRRNKYYSQVWFNDKRKTLGLYDTKEEANVARQNFIKENIK